MSNAPPTNSGIPPETWATLASRDRARIERALRERAMVSALAAAQYHEEMDRSGGFCPSFESAAPHIREYYLKRALYLSRPRYVALPDFEGGPPRIVTATLDGHGRRYSKAAARIGAATRYAFYTIFVLFTVTVLWLAVTAPLNRSLQPIAAPSVVVTAADGQPIARRGAIRAEPVDVMVLPPHVGQAFIAIEDRRFFRHVGIDPWGIARAAVRNWQAGRVREGGSTISQQLAKTSFTGGERTMGRKVQEALITLWLEAWLTKEEILSRYLSNVYFGNNVYGLRAASRFYFSVDPEELTPEQAAMLAAIVNAPNRLAPNRNLAGARRRADLVLRTMADVGYIEEEAARSLPPARLRLAPRDTTPTGTYFADWVLSGADDIEQEDYGERTIPSTLDRDLQRAAIAAFREARLNGHQAALVAMRPDGSIVAMLGGRDYARSPFNRATMSRRQSGSTFKLFVYLAALRSGMDPDTLVDDSPIAEGSYRPRNSDGVYRGRITLREAFARSSNVAAVRLAREVGMDNVIQAARDLGITAPIPENDPSIALGTADVSLLQMTAAYAAVAADLYPVIPVGMAEKPEAPGLLERLFGRARRERSDPAFEPLRDMLRTATAEGTGRAASLPIVTYGKTGTSQDYRDALFIGFAGDLVVGVWVGNDDNRPMPRVSGGGLPARIWRSFMIRALEVERRARR